jgi:hypothetical protein
VIGIVMPDGVLVVPVAGHMETVHQSPSYAQSSA